MQLGVLADRVSFANELHKNKALSQLIQRQLREGRSTEIAHYLNSNPERFFNSLVVAVYGGEPSWSALDAVRPNSTDLDVNDLSEDAIASIGFLGLSGDEALFALDGQHRLAGIEEALKSNPALAKDEISVIFVAHGNDEKGLRRTRGLFTTLNKTARPVDKGEIIALDEADVMAITARDLVENDPRFSEDRIHVTSIAGPVQRPDGQHVPDDDREPLRPADHDLHEGDGERGPERPALQQALRREAGGLQAVRRTLLHPPGVDVPACRRVLRGGKAGDGRPGAQAR